MGRCTSRSKSAGRLTAIEVEISSVILLVLFFHLVVVAVFVFIVAFNPLYNENATMYQLNSTALHCTTPYPIDCVGFQQRQPALNRINL